MNFTSCTPIPFISPSLHICPLPLQPPHGKKMTATTTKRKTKISPWKPQCVTVCHIAHLFCHRGNHGVSQCITQYTLSPRQLFLQMFIAMNHWSGSRPLVSWISCCCPRHRDPAALDLQDWPLHMLQQFIDEVALDLGLGGS